MEFLLIHSAYQTRKSSGMFVRDNFRCGGQEDVLLYRGLCEAKLEEKRDYWINGAKERRNESEINDMKDTGDKYRNGLRNIRDSRIRDHAAF